VGLPTVGCDQTCHRVSTAETDTPEQTKIRHQSPSGRTDEPRDMGDECGGGNDEHPGCGERNAPALPPGSERRRDEKAPLECDGCTDAGRNGDRPDERRDSDTAHADGDENGESGECETPVAAGVGHAGD
jgi:hypothetical protein